jgi:AraC-like DNA-binding protein
MEKVEAIEQPADFAAALCSHPGAGYRPAPSMGAIQDSAGSTRDFLDAVNGEIFRALPRGEPTIRLVARALAVAPKTLARRLAAEGTTFREAVAGLRRGLAVRYLRETGLGLDQIAMLLGYSRAASFRRAFRRWTGVPPSAGTDSGRYEPVAFGRWPGLS